MCQLSSCQATHSQVLQQVITHAIAYCVAVQVLRVIDSLQLTAKYSVATPVDWQNGDKVMVTPNLSDEQAHEKVGSHIKLKL